MEEDKKVYKVVYSNSYDGGFSLSDYIRARLGLAPEPSDYFAGRHICRHDLKLIEAVEDQRKIYGDRSLAIETLRYGNKYCIQDYDGLETVVEPEDMEWVVIE